MQAEENKVEAKLKFFKIRRSVFLINPRLDFFGKKIVKLTFYALFGLNLNIWSAFSLLKHWIVSLGHFQSWKPLLAPRLTSLNKFTLCVMCQAPNDFKMFSLQENFEHLPKRTIILVLPFTYVITDEELMLGLTG